jgi:hypothetical protein
VTTSRKILPENPRKLAGIELLEIPKKVAETSHGGPTSVHAKVSIAPMMDWTD